MAISAAVSEQPESADLVGGARNGDPAALGMLYDAFGAGLFRLAYRLTGTREDAEDVVHDVFVGLPEAPSNKAKTIVWISTDRHWVVRMREPLRDGAMEKVLVAATPPAP